MPRYRLNYENALPATPWGLETATGERLYFREVRCLAPVRTVIVPGTPRAHGYLEVSGVLEVVGDVCTVRKYDAESD